jgi:hypothetical protein
MQYVKINPNFMMLLSDWSAIQNWIDFYALKINDLGRLFDRAQRSEKTKGWDRNRNKLCV